MALLIVFAFIAGAGTAITPCVLPVLPALLSAGSTGGRRRPLGIVLGLAITFTITIVGLASVGSLEGKLGKVRGASQTGSGGGYGGFAAQHLVKRGGGRR